MLGFLFIILIALVAHKLQGQLSTRQAAFKKMLETAAALPDGNQISPGARSALMESVFGTPWLTWNPEATPEVDFARPASRSNCLVSYYGPMDMEVAGDQVLIYDMQLGHAIAVQQAQPLFQTVISIKPPELRLPPFLLRPKYFFDGEFFNGKSVVTDTALDMNYKLESLTPHRAKALFQSELGTEVLIPFLNDHQWTVQWTGKCLIVYEMNRLIDAEKLAEAALEVSEFFELLKSGPAAIDKGIHNLIQETAQRANTNSKIGLNSQQE